MKSSKPSQSDSVRDLGDFPPEKEVEAVEEPDQEGRISPLVTIAIVIIAFVLFFVFKFIIPYLPAKY